MAAPFRVAVTGLGVSRGMLRYYRESPDTRLILLHDIDEERTRQVAAENPGVPHTLDFREVLKSDADMLDVSTPNHCHAEQAVAALEAGKHVLCQKPMAPTVAECRRMCEAARASDRTLGMFMGQLSLPLNHSLRELIRRGLLGKLAAARLRNAHRGPLMLKDKQHWRAKAANIGGGSFMQLAVHNLNLVQWLLDDEVARVCGFARNLHCRHSLEGEDAVAAAGELRGGALIAMESGYSSVGNALGVYGTAGHFTMDEQGNLLLEANAEFRDDCLEYPGPGRKVGETVPYAAGSWRSRKELDVSCPHVQQLAFARAARDGHPAPVPGEVGMRDVAIIQAIYRASETGRTVEVRDLLA